MNPVKRRTCTTPKVLQCGAWTSCVFMFLLCDLAKYLYQVWYKELFTLVTYFLRIQRLRFCDIMLMYDLVTNCPEYSTLEICLRPSPRRTRECLDVSVKCQYRYAYKVLREVRQNQVSSRSFYMQLIPCRGAWPDLHGIGVAGNSWNQLLNWNPYAIHPFY